MSGTIHAVHLDLEVSSVEELLRAQVKRLHGDGHLSHLEEPLRLLVEREAVHHTAMDGGVAFPHARWEGCSETLVSVARLRPALEFGGPDPVPVDLVFLLLGPEDEPSRHVRILGKFAGMAQEPDTLRNLRNATSEVDFRKVVQAGLG